MDTKERETLASLLADIGVSDPTEKQFEILGQWVQSFLHGGYQQGLQRAADVASFSMGEEELAEFVHSLNNALFVRGGMVVGG